MSEPAITHLAVIVPVRDVAESAAFYGAMLGFEIRHVSEAAGIAIVGWDFAEFQLLATDDEAALAATANNISAYLRVSDLDSLYERLKEGLESLPEGRVRPPFDQPYGMREFHVKDPDGCLLLFGQDIGL